MFCEQSAQKEGRVVRQGQYAVRKTDIAAMEFDAPGNVTIVLALDQRAHALRTPRLRLDFNRDEISGGADILTATTPNGAGRIYLSGRQ